MKCLASVLAVLLGWGALTASGQSLAELAKKEKERRDRIGKKAPAFGDRDLAGRGGSIPAPASATPPPGEATAAGTQPAEDAAAPKEEDPTKTQAYWREKITKIQGRIADLERQLASPGFAQDPTNLSRRQRFERDLTSARAELESVREEARTKGVPAGWVR